MYRALYRKYRPQGFDSVVGQNTIVKTLQNSVKNKSFSHAYMFFGPRGVGKTTASKIFARAINCLEPVDGNACGKCKSCVHSFEKECVDIIEIDAASNNGVDEIRELKNKISLVPAELKYKVYIIDEVHMLSIGAFNALLKTLEEPPEHAIFILATTDPQKVPETIISRCQCFSFKRISDDMIVDRLKTVCESENIDFDDEVLSEIAISSDGGMRDALGALDKLTSYTKDKITVDDFAELNGMITKKILHEFCNDIFAGNLANVLAKINKFSGDGKNLIQIMSQLMHFLRNIVVNYYVENSKCEYSVDNMLKLINIINEKMFDIKKSGNPKIYIEMLLIKYIKDISDKKNISQEIITQTSDEKSILGNNSAVENKEDNLVNLVKETDKMAENVEEDDEEYDFDKEFSDDENSYDDVMGNNYNDVLSADDESFSDTDEDSSLKIVKNIDDIMKVRVNNTLANANKQILNKEQENFKLLNDFTFDQEIGYIVCNLLDATVRAASDDSIIISYEYDSSVKQNLLELEKITYVYNKITNSNKKLAIITDEDWGNEKNKYIKSLKDGVQYQVIDEPQEVYEEQVKNDIITNSAVELFGDIVEIN
ncbi:MAG: DNA polymerase III subunit gamma/tau [Bacilli bacterium]|nr:DNA polymerase III subunit gamma/tau [Bacilli bacterium]